MSILHVCKMDKFVPPFIDFVEENFDFDEHFFWLNGRLEKFPVRQSKNIYKEKSGKINKFKSYLYLIFRMHKSRKIILHGLINNKIVFILFFMPWVMKKCYWLVWGGDLYVFKLGIKNFRWKRNEFFRRFVIKRLGTIVTSIDGDYDRIKEWYGASGKRLAIFTYPNSCVKNYDLPERNDGPFTILAGNSGDPTNNHQYMFDIILNNIGDIKDYKIICPLSYGDDRYIEKTIKQGRALFGSRFIALRELIPLKEYLKFLETVDVALFAHNRQQAFSTIRTLTAMGKKVFIKHGMSHVKHLEKQNITVFPIEKFTPDSYFEEKESNMKNMQYFYSVEKLKSNLEVLFCDA